MYLADDVPTCLAEAFQDDRIINRRGSAPFLSGFVPTRTLDLLDLTDGWPLQVGAANAINATDDKARTRQWARAIRACFPHADGLLHVSSMTGRPVVSLFNPAEDALPTAPAFSEPLASQALTQALSDAADEIGYLLV